MNALVAATGELIPLSFDRYRAIVDHDEWEVLHPLANPVLDIGCGPGRVAAAFASRGRPALGIDPSPAAVREAQHRGAVVLRRSVFDPLPGEGRWGGAVLLDGNIGIGGDPVTLLARVRELLRPGGNVVVELGEPGGHTDTLAVRVEGHRARSAWFPWARVAAEMFSEIADAAGLSPRGVAHRGGRWFGRAAR